ncbi:L-histidine N(alpha)-methyltransferase [Aquabacterium sp.]|uniref:L-histidine N(alpha)-methyltransferase n=1 Tax=Aquabacterium sp. TaxID=1872578 RepID=UPI0039C8ACFA
MNTPHHQRPAVMDAPTPGFATELIQGLSRTPRQLSPKWFYDERGSRLFERICELPEYYPTRTELALMRRHAVDMARHIGPQADVVEFGAGASRKIRLLLDALEAPRRFIPIDISGTHLLAAARQLSRDYPDLLIEPMAADFTQPLYLSRPVGRRIGFFPGSSIGNFEPTEALALLKHMASLLEGGGLLIGVDLIKPPATLHAAYNDSQGVTAAFNLNVLARANAELGANFQLDRFAHSAFYNPPERRIEMHLISRCRQVVTVASTRFEFQEGDSIHTENSYKYTVEQFQALARHAGFDPQAVWQDDAGAFSIHWLAHAHPPAHSHRSIP